MKLHVWQVGRTLTLAMIMFRVLNARDVQRSELPPGDRAANEVAQAVHDEAMRILNSIQTTEYRHKTDIDEQKGAYYCDCSGFVGYVLNQTVSKDDGKGPFHDGRKRPTAMEYEKFFAAAPAKADGAGRWQHVVRLADARPGDVIAWRHETPKPGNTGHVVIVDQTPVIEKDGRVRVAEIDSTTLPSADITGDKGKSGIGRRTMWFTVDDQGRPVGYIRGSRNAKPKVESISIGRALPASLPAAKKRAAARRAA